MEKSIILSEWVKKHILRIINVDSVRSGAYNGPINKEEDYMPYMSVKEAASKYGLSERRVQKLCEQNRIEGAERISGVWIIPSDAEKPTDDRTITASETENVLSLAEVCSQLSVSLATGRNWIKLGKLIPTEMRGRSPFFSSSYVLSLKKDIACGDNQALKSRRNKKYVSLEKVSSKSINVDEELLSLIVANAAIQMISERLLGQTFFLIDYLEKPEIIGTYTLLIQDLIKNPSFAKEICKENGDLFHVSFQWEKNEDILGLLYISCLNIGDRKATGSYYTPTTIVKRLIENLKIDNNIPKLRILDPCCGTGNFLLQLPSEVAVEDVYGNDIDRLSVIIARINVALKFCLADVSIVIANITHSDFLMEYDKSEFDYVIGNPPWGYEYTNQEGVCLNFKYASARGTKTESYDVFTEQALNTVRKGGVVSFVLPEAILNVKSHVDIRKLITESTSIQRLEYLGNVFDGVQCPCIILQLRATRETMSTVGMTVSFGNNSFEILQERDVNAKYFSFNMTDDEYSILEKIEHVSPVEYLAGQAKFALGIVTGNNKEYISKIKTEENEMILKGSDLLKYRFVPTQNYIVFKPETFQQVAPVDIYRSPEKLLYRFICNQLVFAYDDNQTLSLNSCNILIPKVPGLSIKYILAILNSRIAQYYFKKKYNSVKILRSHIEQIPIACVEMRDQEEIVSMVNVLLDTNNSETIIDQYNKVDKKISVIYGMTEAEYQTICAFVDAENLFLIQ